MWQPAYGRTVLQGYPKKLLAGPSIQPIHFNFRERPRAPENRDKPNGYELVSNLNIKYTGDNSKLFLHEIGRRQRKGQFASSLTKGALDAKPLFAPRQIRTQYF